MIFKDITPGQYFIDRTKRLAQKTSARRARYGSAPTHQRRARELAIPAPSGITCPYMEEFYRP